MAVLLMMSTTGVSLAQQKNDITYHMDWRYITPDETVTTSDCIGDLSTPLCVVDTVLACSAWQKVDYAIINKKKNHYVYHPVCLWRYEDRDIDSPEGNFPYTIFNARGYRPGREGQNYYRYPAALYELTLENMGRSLRGNYYDVYVTGSNSFGDPTVWTPKIGDLAVTLYVEICSPEENCKKRTSYDVSRIVIMRQRDDKRWWVIWTWNFVAHHENLPWDRVIYDVLMK